MSLTVREAASLRDVSQMDVANACRTNGLTLAELPDPIERLAPHVLRGLSFQEIRARSRGMDEETVRAVIDRAGWTVPE